MPDLTTLLDDLTDRPPCPDPVHRVRARVARRTRRRTAAMSATTTAAVAGGLFAAAARLGPPDSVPALSPTASASPMHEARTTWVALGELAREHPEAFVGFYVAADVDGREEPYGVMAFGPGVDEQAWADEIREAAAGAPYQTKRCAHSFADLTAIDKKVHAYELPSGHHHDGGVSAFDCAVTASGPDLDDADTAAFHERFGDAVVVKEWAELTPAGSPSEGS